MTRWHKGTGSGESDGRGRGIYYLEGGIEQGGGPTSGNFSRRPRDFSVELRKDGDQARLRIVVSSEGLGRSRATVDDILACVAAAEAGLDSLG